MTEQNTPAPGSPEPGPENFDFEAYLDGVSTFPVFKHTSYLDQRSGAELGQVMEELEEVVAEQAVLDKRIDQHVQRTSNAFVDAALDDMREERNRLNERLDALARKQETLVEKIKASAITLTFQVKTPEELGSVTREATREFHKNNQQYKKADDSDLDYVTARSRYQLAYQIAHFCTGMHLPDGRNVPPPNRQGAEKLLSSLISSEMMRLMESVGNGLSASQDWAEKLDAGFPGGGSDVEEVGVDQDRPEGGEVVGLAPADDAHREAVGLG